ncbi:MAG: ATP-binding protein [Candidatus Woesearchaeota archaeon]
MSELKITNTELRIAEKELETRLEFSYNIKEKIKGVAKYQGKDDSTLDKITSSIYGFFSLMQALRTNLIDRSYPKLNSLVYSMFISAQYGEKILNYGQKNFYELTNIFSPNIINFEQEYPYLRNNLMELYACNIESRKNYDIEILTQQFYEWIKNKSISKKETLNSDFSILESLVIKIEGVKKTFSFNGGTSATIVSEHEKSASWEDFGGYEEQVEYFKQLCYLAENYEHAANHIPIEKLFPSGILLAGPPGTGKTMLAKLFCQKSKAPYTMLGVSEIGSTYVFGAAIKLQKKFDEAAQKIIKEGHKISILYIDELDTIAPKRGLTNNEEKDNLVATFNYNMDGHLKVPGVIVIASTNRIDMIDPALLRPGRFEKIIHLWYPDKETVKKIFAAQINSRKKMVKEHPYTNGIEISDFVDKYFNEEVKMSGAFINQLLNDTEKRKLMQHLKEGKDFIITIKDIEETYKNYLSNKNIAS